MTEIGDRPCSECHGVAPAEFHASAQHTEARHSADLCYHCLPAWLSKMRKYHHGATYFAVDAFDAPDGVDL